MSVRAMEWAREQQTGSITRKMILTLLAWHAHPDTGVSYPSVATLAREAECSERTVQRTLGELCEQGLVMKAERWRDDGSQTSNAYTFRPVTVSVWGDKNAEFEPSESPPPVSPVSPLDRNPSIESQTLAATPRERPRDEVWDCLEAMFGEVVPKTNAHARRNKAVADLKRLHATPRGLQIAAKNWAQLFPQASLTDMALATHYPQLTLGLVAAQPPCPICGVGGGHHEAGCNSLLNGLIVEHPGQVHH